MNSLDGVKVVVTGGSRGIGRQICLEMARAGADVALAYRTSAAGAENVVSEIHAIGRKGCAFAADFSSYDQTAQFIQCAADALGGIDVLVYCAGVFPQALLSQISAQDWEQVMRVNLDGAFYACKFSLPYLKKSRRGRIILYSSQAALAGTAHGAHYGASKAGLLGLTYCLAKELGSDGITVNAVLPGRIETDMIQYADDAKRKEWLKATPVGYFGDPSDAAGIAVFLASEQARYITGAKINVNGGLLPG